MVSEGFGSSLNYCIWKLLSQNFIQVAYIITLYIYYSTLQQVQKKGNYLGLDATKPVFEGYDIARLKPVSLATETI